MSKKAAIVVGVLVIIALAGVAFAGLLQPGGQSGDGGAVSPGGASASDSNSASGGSSCSGAAADASSAGSTSGNGGSMLQRAEDAQLVGLKFNQTGTAMSPYYCIRLVDGELVCSVTNDEVTWPEIDGDDFWSDDFDNGEGDSDSDSDSYTDPYKAFGASVVTVSSEEVAQLQAALEDAGVLAWNGFDESYYPEEGVMDMDNGFSFKMLYSDGSLLSAKGYNATPDGYSEVVRLLLDFFEAHEDRSASYPSSFPNAQALSMRITLGTPYGNGPNWRIELDRGWKEWIIKLYDPNGAVLQAGTDVSSYGYVDSGDELPFEAFVDILRSHGVDGHNLEDTWEGGGEGVSVTIYFDNGQAFDTNTNVLPDYEALRAECVKAIANYYEQVRDQAER